MTAEPTDFYSLLGVERSASTREIRRAYRRLLVVSHRDRVLDLKEHLERLRRAYTILRDPRLRRDYDVAGSAALSFGGVRPNPYNRSAQEANDRRKIADEVARHSVRLGAAALQENAGEVELLAREHDTRELADARRRASRDLLIRASKVALLVLLAALAFWGVQQVAAGLRPR